MNIESRLLMDVWELVEDQFPKGQRVELAMGLLRAFRDYGMDVDDFKEASEEDNYLEAAYKNMADPEIEYDYDDED